jgi:hypothetical protein
MILAHCLKCGCYVDGPCLCGGCEFRNNAGCQAPDALGSSAPEVPFHTATSTPGRQHDNP